jgi:hypothetical protein
MRLTRVAAAATALFLFGAASSIGSAGAAATGVGTSKTSTTVLDVALGNAGSVLGVRLLGDDAQSTIDAKTAAAPQAFSKLTALTASSTIFNNPLTSQPLDLKIGEIESRQPGGQPEVNATSLNLAAPGVPVPANIGNIISGTLNTANLKSAVDANGARSSLNESLNSLAVAGGLLGANAVSSTSGADSAAANSSSTRAVNVDAITVLDLGAVLDGLGIDVLDLTVAQIDGLIETLGATLQGLGADKTLQETIDAVQAQVADLAAAVLAGTGLTDTVTSVVDGLGLGDVVSGTTVTDITATATTDPVQAANDLIDALQAALADVLTNGLDAIDSAPLLKLNGIEVAVNTKAADTPANSLASVTGKIGSVNVGSIAIPGIDLVQAADVISGTVDAIEAKIASVLDTVQTTVGASVISLKDLVSIDVLKKTASVTQANGYNVAQAGITGVSATVKPPVDLDALVGAITAQAPASIATAITDAGGTVPELDSAMADLEASLGTGIQALSGGATVTAVQVLGSSEFKINAATAFTPATPTLAATGANSMRLAALGFLMVALGLGLGAWFKMPTPAWKRSLS